MDALALVALHTDSLPPAFSYLTLVEAHACGQAVVSEKPRASVPTLTVINNAAVPILILDGEEIVGGRQNRVVNTTLLVPAQSTFELDVTCVEHGRWHPAAGETFVPGETVYPSLRQQKAAQVAASLTASGLPQADQAAVWSEISTTHRRRGTRSSTEAVHDAYVERSEVLRQAEETLRYPGGEPVGVMAVVSGRAICADIFDRPATLRAYWSSLVRSYALEAETSALARTSQSSDTRVPSSSTPRSSASATSARGSALCLLTSAALASKQMFPSRGLGFDMRLIAPDVLGAALVHHESAVHVALFSRGPQPDTASVSRPSTRKRHLRQASQS
jgi:hypothetical protein